LERAFSFLFPNLQARPAAISMELQLSTPALLFSAITLLMLAYTNRFLAIATLIRGLHKKLPESPRSRDYCGTDSQPPQAINLD
jgi:hypothetical protein